MKYDRQDFDSYTFLTFENGLTVEVNRRSKSWNITGLRKPTLEDLQAIIGIMLEVLTLPVGETDDK